MIQLILYGTDGCHLCDEALEQITQATRVFSDIHLQQVDIIEDETLMHAYSLMIPVVLMPANNKSLSWPFNVEDITTLIQDAQSDITK